MASSREAVYKNEELYNIMRALGVEDGIDGLRYNKVVIATDADVDGMHIRNLLLTYFLRYFEELVVTGHVYILETPLFRVRNKKETRYCYSESRARPGDRARSRRRGHALQGAGRDQPEGVQAVHRRRRDPARVGLQEHERCQARRLDFFMGKNTPGRKEYIVENLIADIAEQPVVRCPHRAETDPSSRALRTLERTRR
jgi:topoisomerase-4 subunit B